MNSRERVLKALGHMEADRVPIDVGSTGATSMGAVAYAALRRHLALPDAIPHVPSIALYDVSQQLASINSDVLNRLHGDVRPVHRLYQEWLLPRLRLDQWQIGELTDGTAALVPHAYCPVHNGRYFELHNDNGEPVARRGETAFYFDHVGVYHPLAEAKTVAQLEQLFKERCSGAHVVPEEEATFVGSLARRLRDEDLYALVFQFAGSVYEAGQHLRGYEQWYLDIGQDRSKGMATCLAALLAEATLSRLRQYLRVCGEAVDVFTFVDDLGSQAGPQISPETYRGLIKPVHSEWWKCVHESSTCRVMLHSCGSIFEILPDLIDAGVDIINPVHIRAKGMDPRALKRDFGGELVFWGGGCDTQQVLPFGTPADVEREIKSNIDTFAPGGGFVFAPVHNIQPDIPPERILQVYDAAFEYGRKAYS